MLFFRLGGELAGTFIQICQQSLARPTDLRLQKDAFGKRKSLYQMGQLFGNTLLDKYRNIVIVDDMQSAVWNRNIPKEMIHREMNILCLVPIAFSFEDAGFVGDARNWSDETWKRVYDVWTRDYTFRDIRAIVKDFRNQPLSKEGHLVWVKGYFGDPNHSDDRLGSR